MFVCYVDETFAVIKRGRQADFKAHPYSIFMDIQFTMEEEEDGALSFLDVLVHRRDDGELKTSVSPPTLSKCLPTIATTLRHTKDAALKPYSNKRRHTAARQKPNKKNSVTTNNNSPSMATRAQSFRRL